jgi:hypothetical protein
MNRTLTVAALSVALCAALAPQAHAQMLTWTDKASASINFGGQAPSHTLSAESTPDIYGEPASIRSSSDVGGGFFFDIAGGYKVWSNLVVGIGYSRVASTNDLSVNADIPDPLMTDSLRPVSTTIPNGQHSQNALYLTGTWMMPVTDKVDVGFQFGPTIFFVSQDLPVNLQNSIQEPGPVFSSPTLDSQSKTTVGIHFGVDGTYLLTPRYGVGVLMRYTWGSADFEGDSVTLGGFQIGAGLRVRF